MLRRASSAWTSRALQSLSTNQPPTASSASSGVASTSGLASTHASSSSKSRNLRVRRPPHVLAVGEHRRVVGDVERRRLAEAVVGLELRERLAGDPLEAEHDLRRRRREEVLHEHPARGDHVRLPQHERADRARPERQHRLRGIRRPRRRDGLLARERRRPGRRRGTSAGRPRRAGRTQRSRCSSSAIRPVGVTRSFTGILTRTVAMSDKLVNYE